jgi:hypothetical protein
MDTVLCSPISILPAFRMAYVGVGVPKIGNGRYDRGRSTVQKDGSSGSQIDSGTLLYFVLL